MAASRAMRSPSTSMADVVRRRRPTASPPGTTCTLWIAPVGRPILLVLPMRRRKHRRRRRRHMRPPFSCASFSDEQVCKVAGSDGATSPRRWAAAPSPWPGILLASPTKITLWRRPKPGDTHIGAVHEMEKRGRPPLLRKKRDRPPLLRRHKPRKIKPSIHASGTLHTYRDSLSCHGRPWERLCRG